MTNGFSQGEVTKKIYQLLSDDAALAAMVTGIYDYVPTRTAYPYITLSDSNTADWSSKTFDGARIAVTLHVYSRARGMTETTNILKRLQFLLHDADLALSGHRVALCRVSGSGVMKESDGVTTHGLLRLLLLTEAI